MFKINEISTTNKLLLAITIPLSFYILKVLGFIFAPLMFAFILTLVFMPSLRWLLKRKIHRIVAIVLVMIVMSLGVFLSVVLVRQIGKEIIDGKEELYQKLDAKVGKTIAPYAEFLGIDTNTYPSAIKSILFSNQVTETIYGNFGQTFTLVQRTLTFILLTIFFLVLLLAGSLNLEKMMGQTLFTSKMRSVKTYMSIEQNIVKFLKVKLFVSILTGLTFGLLCWLFGISFPLFWGLFAFALNFVQMIGSLVVTILGTLFAFIEIEQPGTILLIGLLFTSIQLLFGSVLEPILMGKSFSINIIAVLIMLMFWGYMWGIPGLILSIPITVLLKTLLEQFDGTRLFAKLMS
ncbi:MAG: AI-2E family transporter [Bacteroidales bacterium]|nr:AI-2E family transporter [Bacteroidales bacterium]